jgi:hypothetical protein
MARTTDERVVHRSTRRDMPSPPKAPSLRKAAPYKPGAERPGEASDRELFEDTEGPLTDARTDSKRYFRATAERYKRGVEAARKAEKRIIGRRIRLSGRSNGR